MKKIFKYMIVGLVACTTLSSCLESSLDTNPTDSMSGSGLLANANAALVPLNGLYRSMYSAWSPTDNTHQCFGISAYNLMADVMGEDMIMAAMGSGWFWYDCLYNVKSRYTATTWRSYDLWNCYYTWISNANYILDAEETMRKVLPGPIKDMRVNLVALYMSSRQSPVQKENHVLQCKRHMLRL